MAASAGGRVRPPSRPGGPRHETVPQGCAGSVVEAGGGLRDPSLALRALLSVGDGGLPRLLISWKLGEIEFKSYLGLWVFLGGRHNG